MSKEFKIGIISLITISIAIWGYQYLKGKNLLKKGYSFSVVYDDVEGLQRASSVEINGLKIGSISDIALNPENVQSMLVTFDIQGDFKLPTDTKAVLASENGLVGSKKIILTFDRQCSGDDCLLGGERLTAARRGMLDAIIGQENVKEYFSTIRQETGPMMDTILGHLSDPNAQNSIAQSLQKMEEAMGNLASMTKTMDALMKKSYSNLNSTIENLSVVSGSFASTHVEMETMIKNFSALSTQLKDANLGETLGKTGETIDGANKMITDLQTTITKMDSSFDNLNALLAKADNGGGAIAQLLNNPELYENIESTTKHMALLLQDLRLNPKRYVRLSVFGRKGNAYTIPEDDPAYDAQMELEKKQN